MLLPSLLTRPSYLILISSPHQYLRYLH
jgi:hypothetical protein